MMKTKQIFLKEYEKTKHGVLDSKDILEIEKINKLSKAEIFEIKAKDIVKTKQFVGIVKINNKNIQILPKIFGENNEKIIKNLFYMLSYTKKINIKEADIAQMGKIDDLFEVFIYLFSKDLIKLLKKDFKKNYNLIEENSSFLKGKLIFAKHIKYNLFNKSKFFVEYGKMDENILLNIFLASTTEKLLKLTKSKNNYKLLKKIDFIFQDIDKKIFKNSKILDKISFKRQNKEYKNIFSLAKMLYFGKSPDFSKNSLDNFSILFDMNVLFEEFIGEFLKKNKQKINKNFKKINLQTQNKYIFKNNKFRLKPDILIDLSTEGFNPLQKLIIDTKYKKLDSTKTYNGVTSADIYQMFVYGMRYFGEYDIENKKNIILLYPNYDGEDYNITHSSKENINIFIKTVNMNFDLSCNYGKKKLIKEIKKLINN